MRSIETLYDRHRGEDLFVVGTGTSLADFDFRQLDGRVSIGLNAAALCHRHTYALFCDSKMARRLATVERLPGTIPVFYQAQERFVRRAAWRESAVWFDLVGMFSKRVRPEEALDRQACLYMYGTVACAALMLAWRMAARRIFLLGVDGYQFGHWRYHYDERGESDRVKEVRQEHRSYQDGLARMAQFFGRYDLYQERWPGSGVFNLNPQSYVTAFERVAPADVFRPATPASA